MGVWGEGGGGSKLQSRTLYSLKCINHNHGDDCNGVGDDHNGEKSYFFNLFPKKSLTCLEESIGPKLVQPEAAHLLKHCEFILVAAWPSHLPSCASLSF